MSHGAGSMDRTADGETQSVNFVLRHRHAQIPCRISFGALRRIARVAIERAEIAEQIFDRHRQDIEMLALAAYAAGDFAGGIVAIDEDNLDLD